MNSRFKSLEDLDVAFPTEESCVRFLELLKWGDGYPISPYDKEAKVKIKGRKYFCCSTNRIFDAKTKTIFFGTSTPLIKWFKAVWLFLQDKEITSVDLCNRIDVSQRTAWEMIRRIRFCLKNNLNEK